MERQKFELVSDDVWFQEHVIWPSIPPICHIAFSWRFCIPSYSSMIMWTVKVQIGPDKKNGISFNLGGYDCMKRQAGAATQCSLMVPRGPLKQPGKWRVGSKWPQKSYSSHLIGIESFNPKMWRLYVCNKKTRGGFNKRLHLGAVFRSHMFFFFWVFCESFGSSCFNAQALSVFAIGLPTIYVNVLKQDWNQFLKDLTLT